ncbi:hypothetical protein Hanom_Chr16g01441671 [Helianthus anomalus]
MWTPPSSPVDAAAAQGRVGGTLGMLFAGDFECLNLDVFAGAFECLLVVFVGAF